MAKYRKKPVEVEAWLCKDIIEAFMSNGWAGLPECIVEEQDKNGYWTVTTSHAKDGAGIYIPTLEGTMLAKPDDYIIMGIHGEFYPCKPDIFEQSYDLVTERLDSL